MLFAALALVCSCVEDVDSRDESGLLSVSLTSEVEMEVKRKSGVYDDYNIMINGTKTGQDPYSVTLLFTELAGGYVIPYGVYSVGAESCTPEHAHMADGGLGCARYQGVTEGIRVMSGTTHVSVDCRMVNSKVQLFFDSGFLAEFDQASVYADISVGSRTVTVGHSDYMDKIHYFNVDPSGSEMIFTVYGSIDGIQRTYSGSMTLLPAKFAKVTVKSNHNGIIGPDVTVQDETEIGTNVIEGEIDIDSGSIITGGDVDVPVIYVDYEISPAVDVDCVLDVI